MNKAVNSEREKEDVKVMNENIIKWARNRLEQKSRKKFFFETAVVLVH